MTPSKTGFVSHELYMWHDTGTYAGILKPDPSQMLQPSSHFEHPESKRRAKNLLDASGYIDHLNIIASRHASEEELLTVHTAEHVDHIAKVSETGGEIAFASPMGVGGYEIAKLSTGGCIAMLEAIIAGEVNNGYVLNRPPGHHAKKDESMGFCVFANGSITARAAQARGLAKIAIVDWDVHHGNGAESIFIDDPSVMTISLHQDKCFPPDTGDLDTTGTGAGAGYNINIPLPPGSGKGAYLYAFEKVVIPALDRFKPDLILVASGFDAMGQDPLGRNMLYAAVYKEMTKQLLACADRHCGGKLLLTHEGGYNPNNVPFGLLAVLEALTGIESGIEDPFQHMIECMGYQELQDHQKQIIDSIVSSFQL